VVLYNIARADFEALFAEHKYALSQIERLTPQGLTILSDSRSWPSFDLGSPSTHGGIVTNEWADEFGYAYAGQKGVSDPPTRLRIAHSIRDLHNNRLILAAESEENGPFRCLFTEMGNLIRKYLQLSERDI
jgi:hypothetical protein